MSISYSDLAPLLVSVSEGAPCGPNLEYDPTFLALELEAQGHRRYGGSYYDREPPDWRRVLSLAHTLLAQSKDLRVAIYLLRALVGTEGLPGLARGLYVLNKLVGEYWNCVHPELEQADSTSRVNALAALSDPEKLLKELRNAEVARSPQHGTISVRDVLTLQRTRLDVTPAPEIDVLARRADAILSDHSNWDVQTATTEPSRWLRELRETLIRELGEEAEAPLTGLDAIVAELHHWSDRHKRAQASRDGSDSIDLVSDTRSASGVVPLPDDELSGDVSVGTHFKVYRPLSIRPRVWTSFLVYMHSGTAAVVNDDSARRLGRSRSSYGTDEDAARVAITRGAEVTVVPTVPGCRFNPRRQCVEWLEELHTVEFRLQASPEIPGYTTRRPLRGHVRVYVGPLLIAEIPTSIRASHTTVSEEPDEAGVAQPFSRVFVSYSHEDVRIVSLLQQAYELVRIDYLRDVTALRAGDRWNSRLLEEIDRADRFQLCWSVAASRSPYVEQEWRRAFAVQSSRRNQFICPFYWQKPMPTPPTELGDLHFAYFEFGGT